jgi:Tfp pilus assembly protein PilZ
MVHLKKCFFVALVLTMGSGGLFLKTETPFSVNDRLVLSFTLPDVNKIVTCRAKVDWVNLKDEPRKPELPPGIGL